MTRGRGIVLYSGGLDSLLAARILMEQGLEVTGFHCLLPFVSPLVNPDELRPAQIARQIDLPLRYYRCGREYLDMIKNPPHGYGKRMNPCIDCKIFFIRKAGECMRETGADFVATGEVVGQRPMSQLKHMMNHIEKETNLRGRLLRPLSARILRPTIPEEEGIVDREGLYGISGRGRKIQFELAQRFNISEYSSPAGGCLFTDPFIAGRVRDLLSHHEKYDTADVYLTTLGRHFRISDSAKIIVGRNENENMELERFRNLSDYYFTPTFKGPSIFVRGELSHQDIALVGAILVRYGKPTTNQSDIITFRGDREESIPSPDPVSDEVLESMRI